tara:strand:- start:7008 stop:7604 length:597 start_codon:yes stop_codon:yes gene_type:complete
MRKIKLFEEYRNDLHTEIETNRRAFNDDVYKRVLRIGSFIKDIINFDFSLAMHSIKNKTGYDKLTKLIQELMVLNLIMKRSGEDVDFDDLDQYGLDPDVLLYIEDEDVKEYLSKDPKLFNRIYTHKYLEIFSDYAEWCKGDKLQESIINEEFINKNNFYSCEDCEKLSKSKKESNTCKECGSDKIVHMDEVEWYKQLD